MTPRRGDLYLTDPGPTIGHEQGGRRPFLVLSIEPMNRARLKLVIAAPVTTTDWGNPLHIRLEPAMTGLPRVSYAMPEMARSLSTLRFGPHLGRAPRDIVDAAAQNTAFLIGLGRALF
jgi:mRNA interferase MazF